MKIRESIIYILEIFLIIAIVVIAVLYGSYYKVNDVKNVDRAERTMQNLAELRISIDRYYQMSGSFPDLARPCVNEDLTILDYINAEGKKISFAEIYGKKILEMTEATKDIAASNKVYDLDNFNNGNFQGGWNYNFSGNTGEIHVNLAQDAFNQNIDWREE